MFRHAPGAFPLSQLRPLASEPREFVAGLDSALLAMAGFFKPKVGGSWSSLWIGLYDWPWLAMHGQLWRATTSHGTTNGQSWPVYICKLNAQPNTKPGIKR